jgi:hypothetical protein
MFMDAGEREYPDDRGDEGDPARGCLLGLIIGLGMWAALGVMIYLVIRWS